MIKNSSRALLAQRRQSLGLLLLLLLTFARLIISLDAKDLWLDESFSLQRAESDWSALMRGTVRIADGVDAVETIDQHPFGYFALLGLMLRRAGTSEFALRFPSVMASTLIVPVVWSLARRLKRCGVLPPGAPAWAAILAAISPFYLWYGQEVRMYVFVALMALLSTYMVLGWSQDRSSRRYRYILGYFISISLLLTAHYYSVFILPVHAAIVFARLMMTNRRLALWAVAVMLALGLLTIIPAALQFVNQPGAGTNFVSVSLGVLIPDLVNAFTLGLSVDLADVWPIDVLSVLVMLLGVTWGLLARRTAARYAWLLPAYLVLPVLLLIGINLIRPAYMNARHMSLVSGAYLLLMSSGLAWLWRKQRWLGALVVSVLLGGMLYSTANYYVSPRYDKGDMAGMGECLDDRILPGDFLLIEPPTWTRLFRYYLPIDAIERWRKEGQITGWRAVPPLAQGPSGDLKVILAELGNQYPRIWLARTEPGSETAALLQDSTFRTQDWGFESPLAFLHLELFQVNPPVVDRVPETAQRLADTAFGPGIMLSGYEAGRPFESGRAVPITLYWQVNQQMDRRYKYILRWNARGQDGTEQVLGATEKEPYDGLLPTTVWAPGTIVREYTSVLPLPNEASGEQYLSLQMYDAETLQKLPLSTAAAGSAMPDGYTLVLPVLR